jgi:hypothetical protein
MWLPLRRVARPEDAKCRPVGGLDEGDLDRHAAADGSGFGGYVVTVFAQARPDCLPSAELTRQLQEQVRAKVGAHA